MTKIALSTTFATFAALFIALVAAPAHADEQQRLALNCDLIAASGKPVPPYCGALQQKASSTVTASPKKAPRAEAPKAAPVTTTTTVVTQARPHGQQVEFVVTTSSTTIGIQPSERKAFATNTRTRNRAHQTSGLTQFR